MSKVIPSSPWAFSKEIDSSSKSSFLVELLLVPQSCRTFQPAFFFLSFPIFFLGICLTLDLKDEQLCRYSMAVCSLSSLLLFLILMLWELMPSNCTFFFFFSTPATLDQNYVVCDLQQKVNMLYSFLRTHLKKKTIVFFASCKEVWLLPPIHCSI